MSLWLLNSDNCHGIVSFDLPQALFVAEVFSGQRKLPSKENMEKQWEREKNENLKENGGKFLFKVRFRDWNFVHSII